MFAKLQPLIWPLTSLSRPSSCLLRLPFSHLSASFSDNATCSRASSESRYSFFFFRDRDADSRFFIMRCCLWDSFDWRERETETRIAFCKGYCSCQDVHFIFHPLDTYPNRKGGGYCEKCSETTEPPVGL